MKSKTISLLLIPVNIILCILVFNSVNGHIKFEENAKLRIKENIQKLKDLREIQKGYKRTYGIYADNFTTLQEFLKSGKVPTVTSIGIAPEGMSEEEAIKKNIIRRDTIYVNAKDEIFNDIYIKSRDKNFTININEIHLLPDSDIEYNIDAGMIEKGKAFVPVFEIAAQ